MDSQSVSRSEYEAKLEALHVHAKKLADAISIEEITEYTIEAMANTLGFSWASLGIVEDNLLKITGRLHYASSEDIWEMPIDGPGISVRAVRTGESQFVADLRKDVDYFGPGMDASILSEHEDNYPERIARLFGGEMNLSELDVPVKIGPTVVANLNAESTELNAFTEQDLKLLETLASHVASAIQRIRAKEEVRQLVYRLNGLKPGGSYVSGSHDRCLKAYALLTMQGVPGLSIIRDDPQSLVENYGIKKEEIVLLSSRPFEGYQTLPDLQSVSRALSLFLESGEGVVLLDGLEYLISRFGFDAVFSLIQEKRFDFLKSKAVLLVPMDMDTIESREKALLSSEFTLLE